MIRGGRSRLLVHNTPLASAYCPECQLEKRKRQNRGVCHGITVYLSRLFLYLYRTFTPATMHGDSLCIGPANSMHLHALCLIISRSNRRLR
jgi:hypothetical protein